MKNLLAAVLGLALVGGTINAQAAIVDHGDFFTDTVSGLDWFKLHSPGSFANSLSYQEVTSQMGVGDRFEGWSYASGTQFDALLLGQGITSTSPACSNGYQFCDTSSSAANNAAAYQLAALFGNTTKFQGEFSIGAGGILADAGPGIGTHYAAQIFAGGGLFFGGVNPNGTATISTHKTILVDDPAQRPFGTEYQSYSSFLVRPATVPVPASLPLFASGLFAVLGLAKRRAENTSI